MGITIRNNGLRGNLRISGTSIGGFKVRYVDSTVSIVTSGLVLNLDASNPSSYPGTGTTWFDLSGNSNTGSLTNGPTYSSANGGSIVFDGTNDYVGFVNPATIRNQDFTVSVWINPEVQNSTVISIIDFDHSGSPNQGWVIQSEDATTNRYYYLAWNNGSVFQPIDGGGFGVGKGIQITTSVWQNITYSKNGITLLGYKNGVQVYSGTGTSAVSYVNNKNMQIAGCVSSLTRNFKGSIPNTLIYNRGLSAEEILQNYNAQKSKFGL
jgi:hypothetical protein